MKSIPVIRSQQDMEQWRKGLNDLLKTPLAPKIPYNFRVTACRGGNQLEWSAISDADGYEIQRTQANDFASAATITIEGGNVTSYFDPITLSGSTMPKVGYKLRATSGTTTAKHSVKGKQTKPVFQTPLDPNNTASTGTTVRDTTSDQDQAVSTYRRRFE